MTGRVALVTGGSGAIGAAAAKALAAGGHHVALTWHSHEHAAMTVCADIEAVGGTAMAVRWAAGSEEATEELFTSVESELGPVEILVNVAGIRRDAPLPAMTMEAWDEVVRTDLTAPFATMRRASRVLIRRRWGRIVNVGSVAATSGIPGQVSYAAAKSGLIGLTRAAARELASRGITVNLVAAGPVDTDMLAGLSPVAHDALLAATPVGRFGRPDEIAAAIRFLCSEEASFITGAVLAVDGGAGMGW